MRYYKTVLILFALAFIIVMATSGEGAASNAVRVPSVTTVGDVYEQDILDHCWWLRRSGGWGIVWVDTFCGELAAWLFGAPTGWSDSVDWDTWLVRPVGW